MGPNRFFHNKNDLGNARSVRVFRYNGRVEHIDTLDEHGTPNGKTRSRAEIHRDGDWHRAVHVWVMNGQGEILIQKRSATIDLFPDHWDVSLAGHVRSGEESREAAQRELKEELGIDAGPHELECLGTVRSKLKDGANRENQFVDVYMLRRAIEADAMKWQKSEVGAVEFVTPGRLRELLEGHQRRFVPRTGEYELMSRFFTAPL
jgi:isopentenyldiphosphate isomerase